MHCILYMDELFTYMDQLVKYKPITNMQAMLPNAEKIKIANRYNYNNLLKNF